MNIVSHPVYNKCIKISNDSNAREKLLRLFQYLARFLKAKGYDVANLQQIFMLSRKPLRAFKPLGHFKAFVRIVNDELMDPTMKIFEALKQLALALYFALDTVHYLQLLSLIKTKSQIGRYAAGLWSVSLVAGLVKNLRQWQILFIRTCYKSSSAAADKGINIKSVERDTLKNVLDLSIALNQFLQLNLDERALGIAGIVTSFFALDDIWSSS